MFHYLTFVASATVSLSLVGCAKPVVEYAEPGAGQHYVARKDLKNITLPPAPTTKAWLDGAALKRVTEPVRHSVYRTCLQLKLESARCARALSTRVEYDPDNPEVNAVAYGGKNTIEVFGGLIKVLGTDAEVAAIVSHEFAHIVLNHSQKIGRNKKLGGVVGVGIAAIYADVLGADLSNNIHYLKNWLDYGALIGRHVYSPEMEIEADRLAVYVLEDLGYPPTAVRDLIVRFYRTDRNKNRRAFIYSTL